MIRVSFEISASEILPATEYSLSHSAQDICDSQSLYEKDSLVLQTKFIM